MLPAMHIQVKMKLCGMNQFPNLVEQMLHMYSNRLLPFVCKLHNWSLTLIPFTFSSTQLWFIKFQITQMLRHALVNWDQFDFRLEEDELLPFWGFFWHMDYCVLGMGHCINALWSWDFGHDMFCSTMAKNRFCIITRYIQFDDKITWSTRRHRRKTSFVW